MVKLKSLDIEVEIRYIIRFISNAIRYWANLKFSAFHEHVFRIIATSGCCNVFVWTKRTTHKQTLTFLTNRWTLWGEKGFFRVGVTNTLSDLGFRSQITWEKTQEKPRLPHGVTSHVSLNNMYKNIGYKSHVKCCEWMLGSSTYTHFYNSANLLKGKYNEFFCDFTSKQ